MLRIDQSSTRVPGDGPPASADAHNLCDCEATKLPFHSAPSGCPARDLDAVSVASGGTERRRAWQCVSSVVQRDTA